MNGSILYARVADDPGAAVDPTLAGQVEVALVEAAMAVAAAPAHGLNVIACTTQAN